MPIIYDGDTSNNGDSDSRDSTCHDNSDSSRNSSSIKLDHNQPKAFATTQAGRLAVDNGIDNVPCAPDLRYHSRVHHSPANDAGVYYDSSAMGETSFQGNVQACDTEHERSYEAEEIEVLFIEHQQKLAARRWTIWRRGIFDPRYNRDMPLDSNDTFHANQANYSDRSLWVHLCARLPVWRTIAGSCRWLFYTLMATVGMLVHIALLYISVTVSDLGWIWRQLTRIVLKAVAPPRRMKALVLLAALAAGLAYHAKTSLTVLHEFCYRVKADTHAKSFDLPTVPQWWSIPQTIDMVRNINLSLLEDWIPFQRKPLKSLVQTRAPKDRMRMIQNIGDKMEMIQQTLHQLENADNRLTKRITSSKHQLDVISRDLELLKNQLAHGQWIKPMLAVLRDEIPKYVAVPKNPFTGEIQVPVAFWDQARDLFATRSQVDESIEKVLSSRSVKVGTQWTRFLEENDQALQNLVGSQVEKITREEFLRLFVAEADIIWASLKDRVKSLLEHEEQLKTSSESRTSHVEDLLPVDSRTLTDIEYQLIMDVVDEALGRHSADVVAKPDYALSSAGGSIIPHLTFQDFVVQMKPRFLGRLGLKHLIPANPRVEKRAIKAIQPDVHAGSCWAMKGDHGQIGIQLARAIIVTEVTIEHVDPRIALHYGSAPREMEIWGLASSQKGLGNRNGRQGEADAPAQGASLLTTIEYKYDEHEGKQPKLMQSFQIPLQKQNVVSTGVVVRVNSNWGYPAFTCLYRIRVHGFESTLAGF
ncbi:hypothetical protein BGX34_000112 [Mortierella sp. NVP85]|nr:hypothetical protein BGX34_000112 [Mortierella sp. NVP85]